MMAEAGIGRQRATDNAASSSAAPAEETQVAAFGQGAQPDFGASRRR